jgi:excisionase family DNA binding protein
MSAPADLPAVLTIEETAKVMRIGRSSAYDAARRGELPTIRLGRKIRVPRHRLEAMLGAPLDDLDAAKDGVEGSGQDGVHIPRPGRA